MHESHKPLRPNTIQSARQVHESVRPVYGGGKTVINQSKPVYAGARRHPPPKSETQNTRGWRNRRNINHLLPERSRNMAGMQPEYSAHSAGTPIPFRRTASLVIHQTSLNSLTSLTKEKNCDLTETTETTVVAPTFPTETELRSTETN